MSTYKIIGASLVLLSALIFVRAYSGFLKKRRAEGEELYRFLLHISSGVRRSLATPEALASDFKSETETVSSFISLVSEGRSLYEAFSMVTFSLGREIREEFSELFSGFGNNYLEAELMRLSDYEKSISELLLSEKDESEKSERTVRASVIAAALGIVILLI